jgi:hypothetical protein
MFAEQRKKLEAMMAASGGADMAFASVLPLCDI